MHKVDNVCIKCGEQSCIAKGVTGKSVVLRCASCGTDAWVALPPLKKKIIYLDQNFLSNAFLRKDQRFVEAADRLKALSKRQLITAPWSLNHLCESALDHENGKALFDFIKCFARGRKFASDRDIIFNQFYRAFTDFLKQSENSPIKPAEGFVAHLHNWDGWVFVDTDRPLPQKEINDLRDAKMKLADSFVELFKRWRGSKDSVKTILKNELEDVGQVIYRDWYGSQKTGAVDFELNNEAHALHVQILRDKELPFEVRLQRLHAFTQSNQFFDMPYISSSARVMSVMRRLVGSGELQNEDNARRSMRGVKYDLDAVALYAPYCDAIFMDYQFSRWVLDKGCGVSEEYGYRVFTAKTFDAFHAFLDEVEKERSPTHDEWVMRAYGIKPSQ